jgi:hypothetical protein
MLLPSGAHNQSRKTHHKVHVCCCLLGRDHFITVACPHMLGWWLGWQGAGADGLGSKHDRFRAFWITTKQPVHGQSQAGCLLPTYVPHHSHHCGIKNHSTRMMMKQRGQTIVYSTQPRRNKMNNMPFSNGRFLCSAINA